MITETQRETEEKGWGVKFGEKVRCREKEGGQMRWRRVRGGAEEQEEEDGNETV